jgi:hypothetical protein
MSSFLTMLGPPPDNVQFALEKADKCLQPANGYKESCIVWVNALYRKEKLQQVIEDLVWSFYTFCGGESMMVVRLGQVHQHLFCTQEKFDIHKHFWIAPTWIEAVGAQPAVRMSSISCVAEQV